MTTTHPTLLVAAHGFPAGRRRQKVMLRTLFDGGGRVLSRAHITHEFLLLSVRFQAASRADKDAEVVISKNLVGGIYRTSGTQLTKKLGSSIRMELPKEEKQIDKALSGSMQKE